MKTLPGNEILKDFRELCRLHGCKCTPQRLAVYGYIRGNRNHPDVNMVWEEVRSHIPSITRESVFRILTELAGFGLIARMDKIESARFDCCPGNHGHLICDSCGAIFDFDLPENILEELHFDGFLPDHVELRISGLCDKCARHKNDNK